MIVFDLVCICGFQFEGWFHDHEDLHMQQESGLLTCPRCESPQVHKILSPVAVRIGPPATDLSPQAAAARAALRALKELVVDNFEDVGPRLAETALKMHYGVEEKRNIRGVATPADESLLEEEGIRLLRIPLPPEDETVN